MTAGTVEIDGRHPYQRAIESCQRAVEAAEAYYEEIRRQNEAAKDNPKTRKSWRSQQAGAARAVTTAKRNLEKAEAAYKYSSMSLKEAHTAISAESTEQPGCSVHWLSRPVSDIQNKLSEWRFICNKVISMASNVPQDASDLWWLYGDLQIARGDVPPTEITNKFVETKAAILLDAAMDFLETTEELPCPKQETM